MPLYSWGSNRCGEAGQPLPAYIIDGSCAIWKPTLVGSLDKDGSCVPVAVAAGESHSLVLMESGEVYAFGKGDEGQLGLGKRREHMFLPFSESNPYRVVGLDHETVAAVAAGARTSYAITVSGLVYEWGLVHVDEGIELNETNMGRMTGAGTNRGARVVQVDELARQNETMRIGASTQEGERGQGSSQHQPRTVADVVRESTEMWLTSSDDFGYLVDSASFNGINKEDMEKSLQVIDSSMPTLLRTSTKRRMQLTPQLVSLPERVRASSIAAGYAHVMLLTDDGRLFAAGYNDRGQLGLGHRISTSKFHQVHALDSKLVLSVACGHQHTLCRAIDRSGMEQYKEKIYRGELVGADLYAWGIGVLGQLGLGLIGTSRGKPFPTLVTTLFEKFPGGIVDTAAGANFSVAATVTGEVYSWGHGEYNQHGTGSSIGADYVDHFYYFVPRKLALPVDSKSGEVKIRSLRCGDNFCIGISDQGVVYSWGWHDLGVLGHGKGLTQSEPSEIKALSGSSVGGNITDITCGAHHVLALVSSGSEWARESNALAADATSSDAAIVVQPTDGKSEELINCHVALLSARSPYLSGLCAATIRDQGRKAGEPIRLHLGLDSLDSETTRALLDYIYSNRLNLPSARRHALGRLARALEMIDLIELCPQFAAFCGDQIEFERAMISMMYDSKYSDVVFTSDNDNIACYGHSFILKRLTYFQYMFSGNFKETKRVVDGRELTEVRVDDIVMEGIGIDIFLKILAYIYSGFISSLGVNDITSLMDLFVTSIQMGIPRIAQYAEREMADRLAQDPRLVGDLLAFASACGANRLVKHCERVLATVLDEQEHENE